MTGTNPFSLAGKTALVAGASRGIGLAIAEAMARAGARTLLASRSLASLERAAAALQAEGLLAEAYRLDIADADSRKELAASVPCPDILINVAGINIRKRMEDFTAEEYRSVLATNLDGVFELTQLIAKRMIERVQSGEAAGGKVVHIGSLTSLIGLPYASVYAMTKSALAALTRTTAFEWARYNIQVNCIAPGFILTDLNREMWQLDKMIEWRAGVQANPRMGEAADIGPLAVFLSAPGSDFITGQVIAVDGGFTAGAMWPFEP
ncbi:MAG TPA: SDR family oxidoreductase [Bryobacteraceae bacterium]|nr:SDR family oxidoreductase [Bryobacteraceae bacterium]